MVNLIGTIFCNEGYFNIHALRLTTTGLMRNGIIQENGGLNIYSCYRLAGSDAVISKLPSNISFGQDSEGNWGYIPSGADTVIPFKKGIEIDALKEYSTTKIYKHGDLCSDITGGWGTRISYTGNISFESDHIHLNSSNGNIAWCSVVYSVNKIDLSQYKGIIVVLNCSSNPDSNVLNNYQYYGFSNVSSVVTPGTDAYYINNYLVNNLSHAFPVNNSNVTCYLWDNSTITTPGHIAFSCCGSNIDYNIYEVYLLK